MIVEVVHLHAKTDEADALEAGLTAAREGAVVTEQDVEKLRAQGKKAAASAPKAASGAKKK